LLQSEYVNKKEMPRIMDTFSFLGPIQKNNKVFSPFSDEVNKQKTENLKPERRQTEK